MKNTDLLHLLAGIGVVSIAIWGYGKLTANSTPIASVSKQ